MIPLVIIAGPTAVGKSSIALELAERSGAEIVSADSRQIYRKMTIGTAKASPEDQARVPHHLIDIRDPDKDYSAAEFARDASAVIEEIDARGHPALVVGGTGLYIHALLYGLFKGPGRDDELRRQMRSFAEQHGASALHQQLAQVDPVTARRVHPNDLLRIIRALEVYHLTGHPISEHQTFHTHPITRYQTCFLILNAPRSDLYARIDARVDQMIAHGLVEEVEWLRKHGYHEGLTAMDSVGYKEILTFLAGDCAQEEAVAQIKRNTRRYAKRQLTWFRKYSEAQWIELDYLQGQDALVQQCWTHMTLWKKNTA
jgi:tRNA dimethylallyltransferase